MSTTKIAESVSGDENAEVSLSADEFKAAFRNHPAGVALITADDGVSPVAMTATSVISVSADPAMLVFSVSDLSSASATLRRADTLVVHLLGVDEIDLAKLGATSGIDRFANINDWARLPTGEPYFTGASGWIRGRVTQRVIAGTSTVLFVNALEAQSPDSPTAPLVYHNRTWHHLHDGSRVV